MTQPGKNSTVRFRILTGLQWLALPAMALRFASDWQRLPDRVATHFDFTNHPNGWMSREAALFVFLGLATAFAITATWVCSRVQQPDLLAWGLIGLFYVVLGTLLYAAASVIDYNVRGTPVDVAPVLFTGIGSAVALVFVALATRRRPELPASQTLAEETHASAAWAVVMGIPVILLVALIARVPVLEVRISMGIALLVLLAAVAMAWSGFHYIFTVAGLEIRTLGFRLRSISAGEIRSYAVDRWSALGGYGIRGVGNRRAYVWGNRGVKITTDDGEVFLGHNQPEKIVRDLDLLTKHGSTI